jgi:HEAT repeat protein
MKSWMFQFSVTLMVGVVGCGQTPDKPAANLIQDLKDKDEAVRSYAARELGKAGGAQAKEAVQALTEALKDSSSYVRQAAAKSLGTHGASARDAVPALQKALKDSDEGVRLEAQDALKKIQ